MPMAIGMKELGSSQNLFPIRRMLGLVAFAALALVLSSCAVGGFKEASAVNLELRFYRWDSVCIAKPDTRENGFIPVLNAGEVALEIEKLKVPRGLATVVIGTGYSEVQAARIASEWNKRLGAQGFRRVVALRGNDGMKINEMSVIADFAVAARDEGNRLALTDVPHPNLR